MDFQLTDAGRAQIADPANTGLNAVTITLMAIGDGMAVPGVDDGGRVALRNERQRSALVGSDPGEARIAVRATFVGAMGENTWNVSEVGLIARVGGGAEFLFAYGANPAGADPVASVAAGVSSTIAAVLAVVVAAADIDVTVSPAISVVGASAFSALVDVDRPLVAGRYYRVRADASGIEARTRAQVLTDMLAAGAGARGATTYLDGNGAWRSVLLNQVVAMDAVETDYGPQNLIWQDSGLEATITIAAGSKVTILADVAARPEAALDLRIVRGAVVVATVLDVNPLGASEGRNHPEHPGVIGLGATDAPGAAGAFTYKIQGKNHGETESGGDLQGSAVSRLILTEVR